MSETTGNDNTVVSEAKLKEGGYAAAVTDKSNAVTEQTEPLPFDTITNKLAAGVLSIYEPDLKKIQQSLLELTRKQGSLIHKVQHENNRIVESQASFNLQELFNQTKVYHAKLLNVKKEMTSLHDRGAKLKKRALKLQQQKQKEALQKELQKESEMERERHLVAKPAKKS